MTRIGLMLAICLAAPAAAQDAGRVHVLLVTGLGGEPAESQRFVAAGRLLHETAKSRWGVADSSLIWLAERRDAEPARISGRSTREEIETAFLRLSHRASPGDVLLIVVVGHGSGEGAASRVNMPGVDPTAADWSAWLAGFSQQTVVAIIAASASGDFVSALSAPNRVVMTATKTSSERNVSLFSDAIARALTSGAADADQDGKVSALEAFRHAKAAVARDYEDDKRLLTEHALLDDNGDGIGSATPGAAPSLDGAMAARITFQRSAESTNPRIIALVAERRALEGQLAQWQARKVTLDAAVYTRELERLLVEIATRTRTIRTLQGGTSP